MTDRVVIRGLRVDTHVGVTEGERAQAQTVLVDIEVAADLTTAGKSDDLADTVDYDGVVTEVSKFLRSASAHLLESLAAQIADKILDYKGVQAVTVEIAKETPPVAEEVERIAVKVERPA